MGKNKGSTKKMSVFKVAGAKSLKAKSKAKPVTGNLKKISEIVRSNINKIDKELVNLQTDLRKKKEEKVNSNLNRGVDNKVKNMSIKKSPAELEQEKQKTLQKLEEMQF